MSREYRSREGSMGVTQLGNGESPFMNWMKENLDLESQEPQTVNESADALDELDGLNAIRATRFVRDGLLVLGFSADRLDDCVMVIAMAPAAHSGVPLGGVVEELVASKRKRSKRK
jgi:hypothetical protein